MAALVPDRRQRDKCISRVFGRADLPDFQVVSGDLQHQGSDRPGAVQGMFEQPIVGVTLRVLYLRIR